ASARARSKRRCSRRRPGRSSRPGFPRERNGLWGRRSDSRSTRSAVTSSIPSPASRSSYARPWPSRSLPWRRRANAPPRSERACAVDRQGRGQTKSHGAALERDEELLVETDRQSVRRHLDCRRDARLALEDEQPSRDVDEDEPVGLTEEVTKQVERVHELVHA